MKAIQVGGVVALQGDTYRSERADDSAERHVEGREQRRRTLMQPHLCQHVGGVAHLTQQRGRHIKESCKRHSLIQDVMRKYGEVT